MIEGPIQVPPLRHALSSLYRGRNQTV